MIAKRTLPVGPSTPSRNARGLVLAVVGCLNAPAAAVRAQPAPVVRVAEENDYFDFRRPPDRRPDDNYTQGARITVGVPGVPGWGRLMPRLRACNRATPGSRCGTTVWELGQLIFTPTRDAAIPLPGERPYAGLLYGSMAARIEAPRDLTVATLTAGVTGPPSLAEAVQVGFHGAVPGFRRPLGWAHQLPTELAGSVSLAESRLLGSVGKAAHRVADLTALVAGTVGTLRTDAAADVSARIGYGLAHPWQTGTAAEGSRVGVFGIAGVRADAVARDLFLDGSTFGQSPHVSKEPLTGDWEWGAGLRVARVLAEYRLITQAREYRTGPATHPVGVLALTLLR